MLLLFLIWQVVWTNLHTFHSTDLQWSPFSPNFSGGMRGIQSPTTSHAGGAARVGRMDFARCFGPGVDAVDVVASEKFHQLPAVHGIFMGFNHQLAGRLWVWIIHDMGTWFIHWYVWNDIWYIYNINKYIDKLDRWLLIAYEIVGGHTIWFIGEF